MTRFDVGVEPELLSRERVEVHIGVGIIEYKVGRGASHDMALSFIVGGCNSVIEY